ncbi:gamma-tubulin complex component 4 [Phtheirospermum japonicum]|uniref:Gamma-tubulin complex component 4 n=1 Tax=Phtheirospermum japonicum TaxID=374723 RepID=A0A830BBP4_9LAMI|nr:gamma-tubulin complex component 4 [Phtheirospermum japonicum]
MVRRRSNSRRSTAMMRNNFSGCAAPEMTARRWVEEDDGIECYDSSAESRLDIFPTIFVKSNPKTLSGSPFSHTFSRSDMLLEYVLMHVAESIQFAGKAIRVLRNPSPIVQLQGAPSHQHIQKGSQRFQESLGRLSEVQKKDIISQLPDDILISIIDHLQIDEAVRSSILSNRWRALYKSIPDIYILCDYLVPQSVSQPHDSNMIVNGVDRFLSSRSGVKEIELYASNLVMFEFSSYEVVNFVFEHVPKLESMFLEFWNESTMSRVCTKLIKDLPRLKSLIFDTRGDIYQVSCETMGFNTFGNLRQLSLCLFYDADYKKVDLLLLAPFLQRCPLLQEFRLDTGYVECEGREVMMNPEIIIHSELKKVEITGYGETENEIEFVLYILRSAIRLEQMHISRCTKWYTGWGSWAGRDESSRCPSKWYEGWGKWLGRDKTSWSKKTRETIDEQLGGQAVSKTVQVTIEHSPSYENNWETFDARSFTSVFC